MCVAPRGNDLYSNISIDALLTDRADVSARPVKFDIKDYITSTVIDSVLMEGTRRCPLKLLVSGQLFAHFDTRLAVIR